MNPPPRCDVPLAVVAMCITAATFTPFALLQIDPFHDGLMLKPALDVLSGQTLYRDSFSIYGTGTLYLQVLGLRLFGASVRTLRLETVVAYACAAALLVSAWRCLLPRGLAACALAIWLLLPPFYDSRWAMLAWPSVFALPFQAGALLFLLRALLGSRPCTSAFLCGISSGLTFACRQPVGALTFIAVMVSLVYARRAEQGARGRAAVAWCLTGMATVLVVLAAHLAAQGTLKAWYAQAVVMPAHFAGHALPRVLSRLFVEPMAGLLWVTIIGAGLAAGRRWGPLIAAAVFAALLGVLDVCFALYAANPRGSEGIRLAIVGWMSGIPLALLAQLAVAVLLRQRRDGVAVAGTGGVLVSLASWMQYYPSPDPRHVFWAITPTIGVLLWVALRATGGRVAVVVILAVAAATPIGLQSLRTARAKLARPYATLQGEGLLHGMRVPIDEEVHWKRLTEAIASYARHRPDTPMLVQGTKSLFAALAPNLRNPDPYFVSLLGFPMPDADIDRRRRFVAAERPLVFIPGRPALPWLERELARQRYVPFVTTPWGELLAPGAP